MLFVRDHMMVRMNTNMMEGSYQYIVPIMSYLDKYTENPDVFERSSDCSKLCGTLRRFNSHLHQAVHENSLPNNRRISYQMLKDDLDKILHDKDYEEGKEKVQNYKQIASALKKREL